MKRRILAIVLCVAMSFVFSGCSMLNRNSADRNSPSPDASRAPEPTYSTLSFCDFRFSVPACFGVLDRSASTSSEKHFHPQDNDSMQLLFTFQDAEMSQQLFDAVKSNLSTMLVSNITDPSATVQIISSEDTLVGGLSAQTATFTGKNVTTSEDIRVYVTLVYDLSSAKTVAIFLSQPVDATYDYLQEYELLLSTAVFEGERYLPRDGSPSTLLAADIEFTFPACFGELDESNSSGSGRWYNPEKFSPFPTFCVFDMDSDELGRNYTKTAFISELNDESNRAYISRTFFESFGTSAARRTNWTYEEFGGFPFFIMDGIVTFSEDSISFDLDVRFATVYNESANKSAIIVYLQVVGAQNNLLDEFDAFLASARQASGRAPSPTPTTPPSSPRGVDPQLKAFLDEYEAFVDKYVAFMSSDMDSFDALLTYFELLEQFVEYTELLDEWDADSMSAADLAYYLEVMARCSAKMIGLD